MASFAFHVRGRGLPNEDGDGNMSDPYFKFKVNGHTIYKSETIENTRRPDWERFEVEAYHFGDHPLFAEVLVEVYDNDTFCDDYMCSATFQVKEVVDAGEVHTVLLRDRDDGDLEGRLKISAWLDL